MSIWSDYKIKTLTRSFDITNFIMIFVRKFLKSKWGMEEFMIADAEAVGGRKNFIILIVRDKLQPKELTPELRTYIRTYTYIETTKNTKKLMKRIRYPISGKNSLCLRCSSIN